MEIIQYDLIKKETSSNKDEREFDDLQDAYNVLHDESLKSYMKMLN